MQSPCHFHKLARILLKPNRMIGTQQHYLLSNVRGNSEGEKPSGFRVEWKINPHMQPGSTSLEDAEAEHQCLSRVLQEEGASISKLPFLPGDYDSVFIKDDAIVVSRHGRTEALLCRPRYEQRRQEPVRRAREFERLGIHVVGQSKNFLEGGDAVINPARKAAYLGYGFRSSRAAAKELEDFLDMEVIPLELRDPHFYHLDTAMNLTLDQEGRLTVFAADSAFTPESWSRLLGDPRIKRFVRIPRNEALTFALNWVEVGNTIVMGGRAGYTRSALESMGKTVREVPLRQFQKAGGSAACLVAPVYPVAAQTMITNNKAI